MNLDSQDVFTSNRDPNVRVNPKVVGSMWLNYGNGSVFLCNDNSLDANKWLRCGMTQAEIEALINNLVNNKLSSINSQISNLSREIKECCDNTSSGSTIYGIMGTKLISSNSLYYSSYIEIPAGKKYKIVVSEAFMPLNNLKTLIGDLGAGIIGTVGDGTYTGPRKVTVGVRVQANGNEEIYTSTRPVTHVLFSPA